MTPAELRAAERAYTSTDRFAIARHERPGCKYLRVVDRRTVRNLGFTFVAAIAPDAKGKPGNLADFELLPEAQTITLEDAK